MAVDLQEPNDLSGGIDFDRRDPGNPSRLASNYENLNQLPVNLEYQEYKESRLLDAIQSEEIEREWASQNLEHEERKKTLGIGQVIKPKHNHLGSFKRLLENTVNNIEFSPTNYPIFDGVLAAKAKMDKKGNSSHALPPALERNLAILRNYMLITLFPDGVFDPPGTDAASEQKAKEYDRKIQILDSIATDLGKALASPATKKNVFQRWWRTATLFVQGEPLSKKEETKFFEDSNIADVGIKALYDRMQAKHADMFPPREQTAFSDANIARYKNSTEMAKVAEALRLIAPDFYDVKNLRAKDKIVSIQEGRDALHVLRENLAEGMDSFDVYNRDPRQSISRDILRATHALRSELAEIASTRPDLLNDKVILDAKDAIAQVAYRAGLNVVKMLEEEGDLTRAKQYSQDLEKATRPEHKTTELQVRLPALIKIIDDALSRVADIQESLPVRNSLMQPEKSELPATELANSYLTLNAIENLSSEAKQTSIREAENILNNLRLQMSEGKHNEGLQLFEVVLVPVSVINLELAELLKMNPELFKDPAMLGIADVVTQITYRANESIIASLISEGNTELAAELKARNEAATPDELKTTPENVPLNGLITQAIRGLESVEAKKLQLKQQEMQQHSQQVRENQENKAYSQALNALSGAKEKVEFNKVGGINHPKLLKVIEDKRAEKIEQAKREEAQTTSKGRY